MKKNNYKGKFIVFEGLDGAGGETQSNLLVDYLEKQKKPVEKLTYPDYPRPLGKLIHQFLHQKYEFSPEMQFLLYFADFIKDKEKIEKWLAQGRIVVADRYFTSTIAYQCSKGFPLKDALKLAEIFKLTKPDLIIYLKVSPGTSISRKFKEKRSLDRHEADKKFLTNIAKSYETLIKNQTLSKWVMIDGQGSINQVFEQIKKIVAKHI